ncbi:DASH complex subunit DAM1 [Golovinomyces cichoracearum]|uniref:DASH complex subunit DAM1 n=1 Tax=Golovinomyces cichoracearum TaxID=62708 RepID=A0A420ILD8_9PEZI|nr:DASH complex subunit DAM1 [Golovinomyces cichoracearum]
MTSSSAPPPETSCKAKHEQQNRNIPSRPTTPLRPSSRTSRQDYSRSNSENISGNPIHVFESAFAELSDSMADLEANLMHFQLMHESISRFSENFSSFLYGLHMNAFCVDFPEAPVPESFRRIKDGTDVSSEESLIEGDGDTTFIAIWFINLRICRTTDTSFVENPPNSSRNISQKIVSASSSMGNHSHRSSISRGRYRGRGVARGSQESRIFRASKSKFAKD